METQRSATDVTRINPFEFVYLKDNVTTDGGLRIAPNSAGDKFSFEIRESTVWNSTGLVALTVFQGARTFSTSTNTAALDAVSTYMCDDTSAIRALTISSADIALASATSHWTFEVIDISGGAGSNAITIATEGSETINGAASLDIAVDYGSVVLTCDGSNLFVRSNS